MILLKFCFIAELTFFLFLCSAYGRFTEMLLPPQMRMFRVRISLSLNGIYAHVNVLAVLHTVMAANKVAQNNRTDKLL
jgi:hypothetical protein